MRKLVLFILHCILIIFCLSPSILSSRSTIEMKVDRALLDMLSEARDERFKQKKDQFKVLKVSVQFREKVFVPPNSEVLLTLENIAKMGVNPEVIAKTLVLTKGLPPYQLEFNYNDKLIYLPGIYILRVRIKKNNKLLFINSQDIDEYSTSGLNFKANSEEPINILVEQAKYKVSLINTYWKLSTLYGTPGSIIGFDQIFPYIRFYSSNRMGRYFGCNFGGASYEVKQNKLHFKGISQTVRMCFEGIVQEVVFSVALQNTVKYQIKSDNLLLFDKWDKRVALFEPRYMQ